MVLKDENKARKWRVQLSYKDPVTGKSARKQKRGFDTKKEAQEWERNFLNSLNPTTDITFSNLVEAYLEDMKNRIRQSTLENKSYVLRKHVTPFFSDMPIKEISPIVVRKWQNEILDHNFSNTFTKTVNNQLSAVMNYAVSYYGLQNNPVKLAGTIGKSKADEMKFWTLEQFNEFISYADSEEYKLAFMILFYSGIRIGEFFALTPSDFDFENNTISISKTYVVIKQVEYLNPPKTKKGNRVIGMPKTIMDMLKVYISTIYGVEDDDRVFTFSKSKLDNAKKRYANEAGLPQIRIHDFRHSHASLLINLDINVMTLADRLGHEKVDTTWNTYGHLYPNKKTEIVNKLNNAIFTPNENKK
ncbi:site-specific integrase [Peptostreptococcus equinus]|uniref:Site-specific integrase n=1 Tax=Peptostreptococcus equinus TaxID=3003601 RepID=A0ABY7JPX6_9FIRM|nr:site-specific integrase [Peptostreptococcus sp. CBA3647]WAW15415.1 site-specific integrase [Peptostreptococcus sp. CBA3647]